MTLAPLLVRYSSVGMAARMRVSSVMFSSLSSGTLRSARSNTTLPFSSASPRSPTLFLAARRTQRRADTSARAGATAAGRAERTATMAGARAGAGAESTSADIL